MLKIKNISKSSVSIFYIKDGKNIRVTIKPGEEVFGDSTRTPQVNHFQKIGKITVSEDGVKSAPNNRVITDNAIRPQKKISKEEYLNMNTKNEFESKSILELIEHRAVDYKKILDDNVSVIHDAMDLFDVSVIIPVRGRNEFAEPMYKSFFAAAEKSGLKISYTMVEHSENPEHSKFCKKNRLNYIWIKSQPDELFNKCLAQNMGALFSTKSKYILFHDIDCLMQSDFFMRLFKNIRDKKARAIQNFTGRRVLYINPELTKKVIDGEFKVDDLSLELNEVTPPHVIGAPGGSITIERNLFFEIGGYDPEFFLANSPEDAFFWEKVDAIDKMYISDAPDIELYHMYHPPTWNDNPYIKGMLKIQAEFKAMSLEKKKEMIMLKSETIKEFK